MEGPCIAFSMKDPIMAWSHLRAKKKIIVNYGSSYKGKTIHTWDDGERILYRCELCGGYYLLQDSELHCFSGDDDRYYSDYFPVSDPEEAERLNREYDGLQIELGFPGRFLVQDNDSAPHWQENK